MIIEQIYEPGMNKNAAQKVLEALPSRLAFCV